MRTLPCRSTAGRRTPWCTSRAGGFNSFLEFLGGGLPNYKGVWKNPMAPALQPPAAAMGFYIRDENGMAPQTVTQWLLANGQNLGTDRVG